MKEEGVAEKEEVWVWVGEREANPPLEALAETGGGREGGGGGGGTTCDLSVERGRTCPSPPPEWE